MLVPQGLNALRCCNSPLLNCSKSAITLEFVCEGESLDNCKEISNMMFGVSSQSSAISTFPLKPKTRIKTLSPTVLTVPRRYFFCGFFYVFVLSCVCCVFVRVCLFVLCGHLLGKGSPLGSRLWCLTVSL